RETKPADGKVPADEGDGFAVPHHAELRPFPDGAAAVRAHFTFVPRPSRRDKDAGGPSKIDGRRARCEIHAVLPSRKRDCSSRIPCGASFSCRNTYFIHRRKEIVLNLSDIRPIKNGCPSLPCQRRAS